MTGPTVLKRLIDTGSNYAEMSQKNAEKLVSEFVKAGQIRRKDGERIVQRLVERGRERTEYLITVIKAEVTKQLGVFAGRLDDMEARMEEMAGNLGLSSMVPTKKASAPTKHAAGPSGVAKVTTRKAPARAKAAAKKAPAQKNAAAKKTTAKKSTVKKSTAKKTTTKKKAAAKKAPSKQ